MTDSPFIDAVRDAITASVDVPNFLAVVPRARLQRTLGQYLSSRRLVKEGDAEIGARVARGLSPDYFGRQSLESQRQCLGVMLESILADMKTAGIAMTPQLAGLISAERKRLGLPKKAA